jgi:hypothetical protein
METLADKVSLYQTFGIFLELSPVAYWALTSTRKAYLPSMFL